MRNRTANEHAEIKLHLRTILIRTIEEEKMAGEQPQRPVTGFRMLEKEI